MPFDGNNNTPKDQTLIEYYENGQLKTAEGRSSFVLLAWLTQVAKDVSRSKTVIAASSLALAALTALLTHLG